MKNKTDKILWREFINGSEDSLSFIYHQNIDFLFFYGKKFTIDDDLILDVIQDLFFYLIRKRKSLGETDNIRLYLLKAFRRRLFDNLNKRKKQLEQEKEYSNDFQMVFSIEEKIIFNEEDSEKVFELKKAMTKLNTKQREVLYYRFTCGFDYRQICEIMFISYDSARQMVSRALQILKKYLSSRDFILLVLINHQ